MMRLLIRPLSTHSRTLKSLFAGCSKRSQRRDGQKFDPSTCSGQAERRPASELEYSSVGFCMHDPMIPLLHHPTPVFTMSLFQQFAKCACISALESGLPRCSQYNGQSDTSLP